MKFVVACPTKKNEFDCKKSHTSDEAQSFEKLVVSVRGLSYREPRLVRQGKRGVLHSVRFELHNETTYK